MTAFTKSITFNVEGEPILEFTEDECKLLGLEVGDTIKWDVSKENEVSFRVLKDEEE